jgi:AcrR family transcriptional regulator
VAAIAERGFRLLEASMRAERAKVRADDARAGLVALALGYVRFASEFPAYLQVIFGDAVQGKKDRDTPELAVARLEAYALLQSEVEAGIARGDFRPGDAALVCLASWALVHGLSTLLINDALPEYACNPKLVDFATETLVRMFGEGVFARDRPRNRKQPRESKIQSKARSVPGTLAAQGPRR